MESSQTERRSSICLVVCHVGKLPAYIDCVFRSCEGNTDIHWLILTDDNPPQRVPSNVQIRHTTLDELRSSFSTRLGFQVNIPNPYQLCKFKPAYGYLFPKELQGYDFWGHCDLDVIYGDLRCFLREDILSAYNKIFNRAHLTLYRNSPEVNEYFMLQSPKVPNYRDAFCDPETTQFDEWRGIHPILRYHNIPQYHEECIVDVAIPTRWKYTRLEGTEIKNHPVQVFYWHKGKLFQAYHNTDGGTIDREFAYIHLQKRPLPAPAFDPFGSDGFLITPSGFVRYAREPLSDEDYRKYNQARFRPVTELFSKAAGSLRRRLGLR